MIAAEFKATKSRRVSIRRAVLSLISEAPDRASVSHVIETSHQLALAYLVKKAHYGSLQVSLFGLELEDLALDSIAELFARSPEGQFTTLKAYFERSIDVETSSDADISVALRRLVFSKVNESLFRRYHEADGNLSRIIRNVKDAVKLHDRLDTASVKGQTWIVVIPKTGPAASAGALDSLKLPLAPPEVLESFFTSQVAQKARVRDLTGQFVAFTASHPFYAAGYPLVTFSRCMRRAFLRTEAATADDPEADPMFSAAEIEEAINNAAERVAVEKKATYVGRIKVDETTYSAYFAAIRSILAAHFLHGLETESFYATLSQSIPDLTEIEYREKHRNVLEYLAKLTRTELISFLSRNV